MWNFLICWDLLQIPAYSQILLTCCAFFEILYILPLLSTVPDVYGWFDNYVFKFLCLHWFLSICLSITKIVVWKFPTMNGKAPLSSYISVKFCLIYFLSLIQFSFIIYFWWVKPSINHVLYFKSFLIKNILSAINIDER